MSLPGQRERAEELRRFHHQPPMLVLPNVWDAGSARMVEQAGARAIATTSSGVAAALGYPDGQRIGRELLVEVVERITRVVERPVTVDIEAGYGDSIEAVLDTVRAVIATGAVGFNIEDSLRGEERELAEVPRQVELIAALRELAGSLDVPYVINARVDVYLLGIGAPETRFDETVRRANAYLDAGADCVYPIGRLERDVIAGLVKAIHGPVNILGGPRQPPLADLAELGVARVSLGGGLTSAMLGFVRAAARDVLERGDYARMTDVSLPGGEFSGLFADQG